MLASTQAHIQEGLSPCKDLHRQRKDKPGPALRTDWVTAWRRKECVQLCPRSYTGAPNHTVCRWRESEHHLSEQGWAIIGIWSAQGFKGGVLRAWTKVQREGDRKQSRLRWWRDGERERKEWVEENSREQHLFSLRAWE